MRADEIAREMARVLAKAADFHGAPNAFRLEELHSWGAPRPQAGAMALRWRWHTFASAMRERGFRVSRDGNERILVHLIGPKCSGCSAELIGNERLGRVCNACLDRRVLRKQWQFFRLHGASRIGFNGSDALALARAEMHAQNEGWDVRWTEDEGADWDWMDDSKANEPHEAFCADLFGPEPEPCECCGNQARRPLLASLCGIFDPSDEYRRVVAAELALEAMEASASSCTGCGADLPG